MYLLKPLAAILVSALFLGCAHEERRAPTAGATGEPATESPQKQITRSDWSRELPKRFSEMDTDGSGTVEGSELLTFYPDLPEADQNKDAKITLLEFISAANQLFDRTDKNKDRLLTSEELQISQVTP